MSRFSRLSDSLSSTVNSLLDGASDPDDELDYTYEQLKGELSDVEDGITDLTAEKKRLEKHQQELQDDVEKHNRQARKAVQRDRDDLARKALEKKKAKIQQIEDVEAQIDELETAQQELIDKRDELERRVQEFRTEKETMKARRRAAEAQADAAESATNIGGRDVNEGVERAESATEEAEARAAAMEELQEEGVYDDPYTGKEDIDRELEQLDTDETIESELDTIKRQVKGEDAVDDDEDDDA
ncbi:phage shock protein A [Halobacteriales archaeon QS_8_69_26]|nr:MAG: phage shock protein A [Halobacteriales archaeon QS_8_69_26]